MKTRRKYYDNTYLYEDSAKVTLIGKDEKGEFIRLDQTLFHPQGGGQPSDVGTIAGVAVTKVTLAPEDREEINHYLPNPSEHFKVGDEVKLVVDKDKRLEFAALHTGGHVLANVLRKLNLLTPKNMSTVKSHHFPKEAYFQVKPDDGVAVPQTDELKKQICASMGEMLQKAYPISTRIDDKGVRKMKVGEFPEDPCGGTHLSNTAEMKDFSVRNIKVSAKEGVKVGYDMAYSPGFFSKSESKEKPEEAASPVSSM